MIWQIGDGQKVRIWRDNWLLRNEELKVLGGKGWLGLTRVLSLIDTHGEWDETLIHRIFLSIDADAIFLLNYRVGVRKISWLGNMRIMGYSLFRVHMGLVFG
jgi:hypothetical protein